MEKPVQPKKPKIPNQRLKQAREQRFWTLEDVAIHISDLPDFGPGEPDPYTVGRWERGVSFPSPRYCRALCTIFAMDAQALGLAPPTTIREAPRGPEVDHALPDLPVLLSGSTDLVGSSPLRVPEEDQTTLSGAVVPPKEEAAPLATTEQDNLPGEPLHREAAPSVAKAHRTPPDRKNQQRLLKRVRAFWIHDVLEASSHRHTLIPLRLQLEPTAVANPWQPLLQEANRVPQLLPVGTSIVEVYDQADGALLILGEAGAGKTTLLLELTRTLLERAEQEEGYPIPVVFNLASWAVKHLTLTEWLVEELHDKYQVPRFLGRTWVTGEQISLLLDGLDEVPPAYQNACLTAINEYRQDHGLMSIVVCSRKSAYGLSSTPLRLQKAISLQPLDDEQIDAYLASIGKQSTAMRVALRTDPALRTLLTTPLWLNILMHACKEQSLDDLLKDGSILARQRQIFTTYLQHMLERRSLPQHATSQQMQNWLTWLARQMHRQNQAIFYLEQLQPVLLESEHERQLYERLALLLPIILIGLLVGLILNSFLLYYHDSVDLIWFGLVGVIIACILTAHQRPVEPLPTRPYHFWRSFGHALTCALLFSLISWLSNALRLGSNYPPPTWFSDGLWSLINPGLSSLLLILLFKRLSSSSGPRVGRDDSTPGFWQLDMPTIRNSLLIGLALAVSNLFPWTWESLLYGVSVGWYYLFCFTALALALSAFLKTRPATITPAERISWSWQRLRARLTSWRHIKQAIFLGGLSGLSTGLSNLLLSQTLSSLRFGVSVGLGLGLSYWLLFGLLRAMRSESLHDEHRSKPNEGIRRSAHNGLIIGLISGGLSFMLSLLEDLQTYALSGSPDKIASLLGHMLGRALVIGLAAALLFALLNGWLACWQHGVLRWQLWRRSVLPWHATRFLDEAVERLLLYKIGGGYLFIHRLLQEQLAGAEELAETHVETTSVPASKKMARWGSPSDAQGSE